MRVCLLACLLYVVNGEDVSENRSDLSRKPRFFTFKNIDDDLTVNLEFSIPFITLPFKKTSAPLNGLGLGFPKININPISIILGGGFILGAVTLVPLLLKFDELKYGHPYQSSHHSKGRNLDSTTLDPTTVLEMANALIEDPASFQNCALKISCWTGQLDELKGGKGREWRYKLLSTFINSTAIDEAADLGKSGRNCSKFSPCPLKREQVPFLMERLSTLTNFVISIF